jgi:hypothetical protein
MAIRQDACITAIHSMLFTMVKAPLENNNKLHVRTSPFRHNPMLFVGYSSGSKNLGWSGWSGWSGWPGWPPHKFGAQPPMETHITVPCIMFYYWMRLTHAAHTAPWYKRISYQFSCGSLSWRFPSFSCLVLDQPTSFSRVSRHQSF